MRLRAVIAWLIPPGLIGFGLFWFLSQADPLEPAQITKLEIISARADPIAGEALFQASGCGSCHAAKGAKGDDKKRLAGGHALQTPVGVFYAPNISPDRQTGIGKWDIGDFANAMRRGLSPDQKHYYPAFPYTSYTHMSDKDLVDLFAYLKTLEPVAQENQPHELALPFKWRRGIGLWKRLYLSGEPARDDFDKPSAELVRGAYLVGALGHCGECHTPRSMFGYGGMDFSRWLEGARAPEGEGKIPAIAGEASAIRDWSKDDIVTYLQTGFTPDFDSVGGSMVSVQDNLSRLPKADLAAIAEYLKMLQPEQ